MENLDVDGDDVGDLDMGDLIRTEESSEQLGDLSMTMDTEINEEVVLVPVMPQTEQITVSSQSQSNTWNGTERRQGHTNRPIVRIRGSKDIIDDGTDSLLEIIKLQMAKDAQRRDNEARDRAERIRILYEDRRARQDESRDRELREVQEREERREEERSRAQREERRHEQMVQMMIMALGKK